MTVREIVETMDKNTLFKIIKGSMVFAGYGFSIPDLLMVKTVKKMDIEPELRRKDWEAAGTWEPLIESATPQYSFKDLDLREYMRLTI